MTYRRDSDIFSPYGEMTSIRTDSRDNISGGKMDKKELNSQTIDDRYDAVGVGETIKVFTALRLYKT